MTGEHIKIKANNWVWKHGEGFGIQSTHSLLDSILESPFGFLEVVLALVHCTKVAVVGEHLQCGHYHDDD